VPKRAGGEHTGIQWVVWEPEDREFSWVVVSVRGLAQEGQGGSQVTFVFGGVADLGLDLRPVVIPHPVVPFLSSRPRDH
jgi:hypothetical protein